MVPKSWGVSGFVGSHYAFKVGQPKIELFGSPPHTPPLMPFGSNTYVLPSPGIFPCTQATLLHTEAIALIYAKQYAPWRNALVRVLIKQRDCPLVIQPDMRAMMSGCGLWVKSPDQLGSATMHKEKWTLGKGGICAQGGMKTRVHCCTSHPYQGHPSPGTSSPAVLDQRSGQHIIIRHHHRDSSDGAHAQVKRHHPRRHATSTRSKLADGSAHTSHPPGHSQPPSTCSQLQAMILQQLHLPHQSKRPELVHQLDQLRLSNGMHPHLQQPIHQLLYIYSATHEILLPNRFNALLHHCP